jgi:undecaprenyl-diphosphatase
VETLRALDHRLFHLINDGAPPLLGWIGVALSYVGSVYFIPLWTAIAEIVTRVRRLPGLGYVLVAEGAATAADQALKHLIQRPRPVGHLVGNPPYGTSFPSGHTTSSFALAVALTIRWPKLGPFVLPLAALIGLSRIVVGAHYPTDVAAGALLGSAVAIVVALAWTRAMGRTLVVGRPLSSRS